jgi:2'-5' RNA ligase
MVYATKGELPGVFGLVLYMPDPLGRFLDDLRHELVPAYNLHAHVSMLPPRPVTADWRAAEEQARGVLEAWPAFEIELGEANIFPVTDVVYLEIGRGADRLSELHSRLNAGTLEFAEPFAYHPHVTLAQDLAPEAVTPAFETVTRRWREYDGPRAFLARTAVWVRNHSGDGWLDLAQYEMGGYAKTRSER